MSLIATKNIWFSVKGVITGGVVGYFIGAKVEDGELLWPIVLAGCICGLLFGGLVRVVLRAAGVVR
jgi:hypothetical protein